MKSLFVDHEWLIKKQTKQNKAMVIVGENAL